jgi:hypothetical protein
MLFRVRKALAVVLMAGSAAGLAAGLLGWWYLSTDMVGLWAVLAALVVGTVGLARGAWWGRIVPLVWSAAATVVGAVTAVDAAGRGALIVAGAVILAGCVSGRQMFDRYEGQAPPPLDWRQPGMGLVRAALLANLYAFLAAVTVIPLVQFTQRCVFSGIDMSPLMAVCLAMTAVLLLGVVLLARQRTAGLLLVAVSAVGLPLVLLASRRPQGSLGLAIILAPGILCGWLALGRFVPGMVRLLRR